MSEPTQSALVVLVPQAEAMVRSVRARYGLAFSQVPAHITVLYPFKPLQEITAGVIADLRCLFARFAPFSFVLSGLGTFPDALYLIPTPGEPFVELTRAVYGRFPETPPYGGAFDEIVPHLTLGHRSDETPTEWTAHAAEVAVRAELPIQAVATEVKLFDNSCGEWCEHTTFTLGALEDSP
jgi:2'-5' RNA ligase